MPESGDRVQDALAKLKLKFAGDLPAKVARVEAQTAAFLAEPWKEQVCSETYRLIHSLAGSAGTYGHSELGSTARVAEGLLKGSLESRRPLGEPEKKELSAVLAKMRELAAAAAAG
ncbi:MAG TPA: Hpt domain-containing protein [Planctomycetota bacterium]|nr:Hpt domain-containing protein [Planctomycetota bacterium]